jgi:hypothetical protein
MNGAICHTVEAENGNGVLLRGQSAFSSAKGELL